MDRRRLLMLVPLGLAGAIGAGFYSMLNGLQTGSYNPRGVPSPLVGHHVPHFKLPGLTDADLVTGKPVLVNFFASWCIPCVEEMPVLLDLRQGGVTVIGIAYKDKPKATTDFLARHGDPYTKLSADAPGTVAIDWGLSGVPETFLVDPHGIVRWHYALPLTETVVADQLAPLLRQYA